MFYVLDDDNKIAIADNSFERLQATVDMMPALQGHDILETEKEIVNYNGKYYFADDAELIAKRQAEFEKGFFQTSLGWIRRSVNMADGSHKDFISDLLPIISMGVQAGSPVTIIAYTEPDFTEEVTDWTQYQHVETVTPQFIQECFAQLQQDFLPTNGVAE